MVTMLRDYILNGAYPAMQHVYASAIVFVLYLIFTISIETVIVYYMLPDRPVHRSDILFSFIIANGVSALIGVIIYAVVFQSIY